jgi:caffeoyl-CoA O-methyltransferase
MKGVPLNDELYNYIIERYVPGEKLLDELVAETEKEEIPLIQVSPEQGKLLYLLTKMLNAKDALEIGTLTGYSGIHIARGLAAGGRLVTVDINPHNSAVAGRYFEKAGLKDSVELVVANAVDYMKQLSDENKKFDLIFIDADKINYPVYYEEAIKLSHSNTVIIFDNSLREGNIIREAREDEPELKQTQATNDLASSDTRVESLLLPVGDGMLMARVK